MSKPLTLPELLDVLGYSDTEHVAVCEMAPGGTFATAVVQVPDVLDPRLDVNVYFGVNPVTGPARRNAGRGTADQVTRLAALYADLDVKAGGLASFEQATNVIDTISDMLHTRPAAIVFSGHGYQPYWPIDDGPTGPDARALLRRFGRLVAGVAERNAGKVDSVYDLSRVLRVPGSINHKAAPVPVVAVADTGYALQTDDVLDSLNAYGIPEQPEDREALNVILSDSHLWEHADQTCAYTRSMIAAWETDQPVARHPWLLAQATRLAAAHRLGCISHHDHQAAIAALSQRFRVLLTHGDVRTESPGELSDAIAWGQQRIRCKPDTAVTAELGTHTHTDATLTLSGATPPLSSPRTWTPTVIQGGAAAATDGTSALELHPAPTLARSEDAHAQLLVAQYGDQIRFCYDRGLWLAWNGHVWRWQPRSGGIVREYAKDIARALPASDGGATSHKKRSLSSAGIAACLSLAQTDPKITVGVDQLDANPWSLNTPGGIVDLRTGRLRPTRPEDLCTRTTRRTPDPSADDSRWQAFLADTFDDPAVVGYLQRLVGYSAIGMVGPHVLPFGYGSGGNGKGVFLESLTTVLGDYATSAPVGFLMARSYSAHETEIARLAGARMVLCSEVNEGDRFDEAKVKQLTGGDTLTARFMKQDHFTFTPTHQLWLMGNHKPEVRSGGKSFFRRLRLIGFNREVPDDKIIDDLQGILARDCGPALMAWIVAGAVGFATGGLDEPKAVIAATEEYAHDSDSVSCFLDDRCIKTGEQASTPVGEIRASYERYCNTEGLTAITPKSLTTTLERLGVTSRKRHHGARHYIGLMLAGEEIKPGVDEPKDEWWQ